MRSAPNTSRVGTRRTATTAAIPEEAVQETSNETHEAFKKELEARPDWRTPIFKYIKDGELPAERWEARKIKARNKYMEPYQNRDQTVQDSSADVRLPSRTAQDDRAVYRLDRTSTRPSQPSREAKVNIPVSCQVILQVNISSLVGLDVTFQTTIEADSIIRSFRNLVCRLSNHPVLPSLASSYPKSR
ncbi:hypothetical protein F2Q68_00016137 [Brassica cretica]|uniref:Uncharacterized protein n=1 Tax=Brassica cretica TaxID=69181 RepID=A0A8S9HBM3_BRACR|nr:hypothetical protein F2Q68_00016137 [Brassica cretica]